MNEIESRLAKVERQLRFHRTIIAGLLLSLVALVGYGATRGVPDVIRARKFAVVNVKGREVVAIESWKHGGMINTYPAEGEYYPSVSLTHSNRNDGLLLIRTKEGKDLIYIGGSKERSGVLKIYNRGGKELIYAGRDFAGSGLLTIHNSKGSPIINAGSVLGGGVISIINKTGEIVVQAGADKYGLGLVWVGDRQKKGRSLKPR